MLTLRATFVVRDRERSVAGCFSACGQRAPLRDRRTDGQAADGWAGGRTDRRADGWTTEGRTDGWTDRRTDGQAGGRRRDEGTDGQTGRWTDGQTSGGRVGRDDGATDRLSDQSLSSSQLLTIH